MRYHLLRFIRPALASDLIPLLRSSVSVLTAVTGHQGPFPVVIMDWDGKKGPDGRGLTDDEEEKMLKIITVSDLKSRSDGELQALFSQASKSLIKSDRSTAERHYRIAALNAVQSEINRRGSVAWRNAVGL